MPLNSESYIFKGNFGALFEKKTFFSYIVFMILQIIFFTKRDKIEMSFSFFST